MLDRQSFLSLSLDDIFRNLQKTYGIEHIELDMDTMMLLDRATVLYFRLKEMDKVPEEQWSVGDKMRYNSTYNQFLDTLKELRKYRLKQKQETTVEVANIPDEEEILDILQTFIKSEQRKSKV